jgi:predicted  nucleic acid-binding Zn-ribbon protein
MSINQRRIKHEANIAFKRIDTSIDYLNTISKKPTTEQKDFLIRQAKTIKKEISDVVHQSKYLTNKSGVIRYTEGIMSDGTFKVIMDNGNIPNSNPIDTINNLEAKFTKDVDSIVTNIEVYSDPYPITNTVTNTIRVENPLNNTLQLSNIDLKNTQILLVKDNRSIKKILDTSQEESNRIIRDLNTKIERLNTEIERLKKESSDTYNTIVELNKQIDLNSDNRLTQLKKITQLKTQITQLKTQITQLTEAHQQELTKLTEAHQQELTEAQTQLNLLNNQLSDKKSEKNIFDSSPFFEDNIDDVNNALHQIKINNYENGIKQLNDQINLLNDNSDKLHDDIDRLNDNNDKLMLDNDKLTASNKKLMLDNNVKKKSIQSSLMYQEYIDTLKTDMESSVFNKKKMDKLINEYKEKLSNLQIELENAKNEYDKILVTNDESNIRLQDKIKILTDRLTDVDASISRYEEENDIWVSKNRQLRHDRDTYNKNMDNITDNLSETTDKLSETTGKLTETTAKLTETTAKLTRCQTMNSDTVNKITGGGNPGTIIREESIRVLGSFVCYGWYGLYGLLIFLLLTIIMYICSKIYKDQWNKKPPVNQLDSYYDSYRSLKDRPMYIY